VLAVQTQDVVPIVAAVLVPVVTAAVGALGLMFQDWRVTRSNAGRRKLRLEEATQRVTFTAEWWKARQAIDSTPEELNQAAARAGVAERSIRTHHRSKALRNHPDATGILP
jgi:hypothetical protein